MMSKFFLYQISQKQHLYFLQIELSRLSEEIHFQIRLCDFSGVAPQLILVNKYKNILMLLCISLDWLWRTTDLTPLDFWGYMEYGYQEESKTRDETLATNHGS